VVEAATFAAVKEILPVPEAARPIAVLLFVQEYVVPGAVVVKLTVVSDVAQATTLAGWFTCAVGFTVIVAVTGVPEQLTPLLVNTGVTVIVAVTGAPLLFTAVNVGIVAPEPLAARPMDVLLLVQLKTVPITVPEKLIVAVGEPLQTVWLAGAAVAVGVGLIVIVNCTGAPEQVTPLLVNEAVTVKVAVTGAVVVLEAVKAGTLPTPLVVARPIVCAVRDHEKVAPGTLLVNTTEGTAAPLQCVWLATGVTDGIGFTVIVKVIGVPVHTAPTLGEVTGVTVIVAVTGVVPEFCAVNDGILPLPLAARPMEGVLFVQL
jgi:hypothetical protein